MIGHVQCVAT
uniref:Uncharacterized protein n=1 Tax=Arundo donax TaxID=35708 RepID=A0A0A9EHW2_ARUDO